MFDLIFDLIGFGRSRSFRYGTRIDPTDLDNGYLGIQNPTPETASRDYFRENSPSASAAAKRNGSQYDQQYCQEPYFNGQEEVGANSATILAVLALLAIVAVIALYAFVPAFHLQIDSLLHP